jgi:hypothetical protein
MTTEKAKAKRAKRPSEPGWTFEGRPFASQDVGDAEGFVYRITDKATGIAYIGKKSFWASRIKTFKTGRKRRRIRQESDWQRYWSSSEELQTQIDLRGHADFRREILAVCQTKRDVTYMEEYWLFSLRVLETDRYINSNIAGRFFKVAPEVLKTRRESSCVRVDSVLQ